MAKRLSVLLLTLALLCPLAGCSRLRHSSEQPATGAAATQAASTAAQAAGQPAQAASTVAQAAGQPAQAASTVAAGVSIPIFCFHDLGATPKDAYSVSTKSFGAYVKYLHSAGFQTVSLAQVAAFLSGQGTLPQRPVVLTFDDGWKSALTVAKPILDKFGYTATVFVIAQSVGSGAKRLTWEDLKALRQAGYEVGSHTLSHTRLTKLAPHETKDAYEKRIRKEIGESKRLIDQGIGEAISVLAYPYGLYDEFIVQATQEEGYSAACSIDRGPADAQSAAMRLPRQMVVNKTSMKAFEAMCAFKPLHLADVKPTIGTRVSTRSASISFDLGDGVAASQARVDLAPGKVIKKELAGSKVTLSVRLDPGANAISVAAPGRITSWLIVCNGG